MRNYIIELMEENFKDKEKLFNYKLFEKNEISSSGDFDIPTFKLDRSLKPLQNTIGVLLLTLLKEKKYSLAPEIEDKKKFILFDRFKEEENKFYSDLCDISLFIGNGWIITVFDINYNHLLSVFQDDPFKLLMFLFFSVENAFLETRILYYDLNPDVRNPYYQVFSFISSFNVDNIYYASYLMENYGICPSDRFNKTLKIKAKPIYNLLAKMNKERFKDGDNISVSIFGESESK